MLENAIEFLNGQETVTATFCEKRYKNRIKKLAEPYPDKCRIISTDFEGGMLAEFPVEWLAIAPPRHIEISEERREQLCRNMREVSKLRHVRKEEAKE